MRSGVTKTAARRSAAMTRSYSAQSSCVPPAARNTARSNSGTSAADTIAVSSGPGLRGLVAGLAKRALRPVTVWTLRHLTDQLNAYHLAETELLRAIVQTRRAEGEDSDLRGASG